MAEWVQPLWQLTRPEDLKNSLHQMVWVTVSVYFGWIRSRHLSPYTAVFDQGSDHRGC